MKYLLFLFLVCVGTPLIGQTKLISHKSHSGTNATFNPQEIEGNFGLPPIIRTEINKNEKSQYKLLNLEHTLGNRIEFMLIKRPKSGSGKEKIDTILIRVNLSGDDSKEIEKLTKKMMVKKLKEYRKKEKS